MKRKISLALAAGLLVLLPACMSTLTGDSYSRDEARRIQTVKYGEVISTRMVVLEGTKTGVGTVVGGAIGGIAGSAVGQGRGSAIAGIVGAVAGGVVGSSAEEATTKKQGIEITLKMDSGETIAVVQELAPNESYKAGERVRLLQSGGTTRVTR